MTHQTQLLALLKAHQPIDQTETTHHQHIQTFVTQTSACTSRQTLSGHVTASAWILSPDANAALLTHHRKLNRWLQPGGHIDPNDTTIQDAALREAREESGISDLRLLDETLFDVDVHTIPTRKSEPEHFHYDVRFVFQAPTHDFVVSEESNNLAWIALDKISELVDDESVLRMVRKSNSYKTSGK